MRVMSIVLAQAVLVTLAAPAAHGAGRLSAGAFAQDITPDFPISVNGGMADRTATHAHDPLHARALVLGDGTVRLVLVVCDSCALPRAVFDRAKELASQATGIPAEHMLISATHTHSAPTATAVFQSEPDPKYLAALPEKIARAISTANERLQPAQVGWGVGLEPNQVFNRRWHLRQGDLVADPFGRMRDKVQMNPPVGSEKLLRPAGPTDPEVWVLSARTEAGEPLALLADYSLHYVGDVPPAAVSADYFGAFAERAGQLLEASQKNSAFVALLANGTSGDINNINFQSPHGPTPTFGRIRLVADAVAKVAVAAAQSATYSDNVTLDARQAEIELAVRKPDETDLARARDILAKAEGPVLNGLEQVYARETVKLAEFPDSVRIPLQVLRVGDLAIVAIPCETFVEIGLEIKRSSPFPATFTIELANGYNGYLPTPAQHALGGYETWRARSSYLEVDASTKIVATIQKLLSEIALPR